MRLIDADALKKAFDRPFWEQDLVSICHTIDNAPTIEVTKVKCKNKDKYWCYSQCPYADTCENGTYER